MRTKITMLAAPLAFVMLITSQMPANAIVGALMLLDRYIKKEASIALSTPGHAEWCADKYPGYRKQWNNYRIEEGRVAYCASPFYTPPWMKWRPTAGQ